VVFTFQFKDKVIQPQNSNLIQKADFLVLSMILTINRSNTVANVSSGATSSIIGGGGYSYICVHRHKNKRFQKKLIMHNTKI
jgi:hypothetical protein